MAREVQVVIKSHGKKLNISDSGDPSKEYLRDIPGRPVVGDACGGVETWLARNVPSTDHPTSADGQALRTCPQWSRL